MQNSTLICSTLNYLEKLFKKSNTDVFSDFFKITFRFKNLEKKLAEKRR